MYLLTVNHPDPDLVRVFGPFDSEEEAVAIGEDYSDDDTGDYRVRVSFIEPVENFSLHMTREAVSNDSN